jgi:hypothetical protein
MRSAPYFAESTFATRRAISLRILVIAITLPTVLTEVFVWLLYPTILVGLTAQI